MIVGWFEGGRRRPVVEGALGFPRLGIEHRMTFLVDTGCDTSTVMPADSNRMALPWPRLRMSGLAIGVGGAVREFSEPAALAFRDTDGGTYVYRLNISIMPPSTIMGDIPSLLGRDILNRWRMVYDPSIDELSFEVHTADRTLAPRPPGR